MADGTMMTGQGDTTTAQGEQGQVTPPETTTEETTTEGQETETKAEGETGEGEGGESEAGEETGVPEKYEWTAPEGFEGELDQATLESFEPVARELGLNQEQADKLVALHAQSLQKANESAREQQSQQLEQWQNDLRNDPEFGGAKFDANVKAAQKAVESFGSPGLKEALEESGLGNHPELVRTFAQIGKAISEDGFIPGGKSSGPRSAAELMYPNHSKG